MNERLNQQLEKHPRLAGGALFLFTFMVFQETLAGRFVFDDIPQILQNPFVTNPRLWPQIFLGSVWSFRGPAEHDYMYRPLQFAVYWVLCRLGGPDPAFFHFFHLLFYAATVWLVFYLGVELLRNHLAAFAGALLWALHPTHVEAAAWISALPDAGSAFFYLLGFWLFLRAENSQGNRAARPVPGTHDLLPTSPRQAPYQAQRGEPGRRPWQLGTGQAWYGARHAVAALAYFPALFFKEMALSFPLLLVAYGVYFPAKGSMVRRALRWTPYLGAVGCYVAIRLAVLGRFSAPLEPLKIPGRVVAAAVGLLGQHARLFFWPARLSAFRSFDLHASLVSPWPWLTLGVLATACLLRKRQPLPAFLAIAWAVMLLPCLDLRQVSFPLADRFSFLPSVALCFALAYGAIIWLPARAPAWRHALAGAWAGLACLSALWAVQDVRQIPHWLGNEALWNYSVQASPNTALVHLFRATILRSRYGDLDGATREFQTALRLNQASDRRLVGVAYDCYLGLGEISNTRDQLEQARSYYEEAIAVAPSHAPAYKALGSLYFPREDYARSARYFTRAVELGPQDIESRFFLGTCWLKLGKPLEAAKQFHAARVVDPTYSQAFEAEARALQAAGDAAGAAQVRSLAKESQH